MDTILFVITCLVSMGIFIWSLRIERDIARQKREEYKFKK